MWGAACATFKFATAARAKPSRKTSNNLQPHKLAPHAIKLVRPAMNLQGTGTGFAANVCVVLTWKRSTRGAVAASIRDAQLAQWNSDHSNPNCPTVRYVHKLRFTDDIDANDWYSGPFIRCRNFPPRYIHSVLMSSISSTWDPLQRIVNVLVW